MHNYDIFLHAIVTCLTNMSFQLKQNNLEQKLVTQIDNYPHWSFRLSTEYFELFYLFALTVINKLHFNTRP